MPLKTIVKDDDKIFQYSQIVGGKPYNWCWFFSNLIAMSILSNIDISNYLQWFVDRLLSQGIQNKGYEIEEGMRLSIPLWIEKFPQNKMIAWIGDFGTPKMWRHLYQRKPIVLWINTGAKYWADREDGVLNELIFSRKDNTSSHAIVCKMIGNDYYFIDSRGDGKLYKVTRQYMESVKGLLAKDKGETKSRILFFDKK